MSSYHSYFSHSFYDVSLVLLPKDLTYDATIPASGINQRVCLRATRQRERRVLATGAPEAAEQQVYNENQSFAV